MFVQVKNNPHSYRKPILVCYSKRINNKPRQFVIKNFGSARAEEDIQKFKAPSGGLVDGFEKSFSIANLKETNGNIDLMFFDLTTLSF